MRAFFRSFAQSTSAAVGSPWAFMIGVIVTLLWAATGPFFHFSDTWQLVINTATSLVTFLMVFIIQSTQSRDAKAMHLKLDELIRAVGAARTHLVHLENLTDDELTTLAEEFQKLQDKTSKAAILNFLDSFCGRLAAGRPGSLAALSPGRGVALTGLVRQLYCR